MEFFIKSMKKGCKKLNDNKKDEVVGAGGI